MPTFLYTDPQCCCAAWESSSLNMAIQLAGMELFPPPPPAQGWTWEKENKRYCITILYLIISILAVNNETLVHIQHCHC